MRTDTIRAAVVLAVLGASVAIPTGAAAAEQCPYNLNYIGFIDGQELTCLCPAVNVVVWNVYGTDRYTTDSDLCSAALHAGAIPKQGGEVTVFGGGECSRFVGSERNGVPSSDYGRYEKTFAFTKPLPPCADDRLGEATSIRVMGECLARGESTKYCQCELKVLLEKMGPGSMALLHAINDEVGRDQSVGALAAGIAKRMSDGGLSLEALPVLKAEVKEIRAAVQASCVK